MKKLTTEEYIEKAIQKHGNLYDYSKTKYVNSTTKVTITCRVHGDWETNARNHISMSTGKCGCPKCAGKGLSTYEWIDRFNKVHLHKFDYSKFKYNGIYKKSIIICHKHGEFEQSPHNHSQGQQCPTCSKNEAWIHNSYYNVTNANKFKDVWEVMPCSVYIVKMYSNDEEFYKIGITSQRIEKRFRTHDIPYSIEVIKIIESNRYEAILLETKLHESHKQYSYTPNHYFRGYTECFSIFKGL